MLLIKNAMPPSSSSSDSYQKRPKSHLFSTQKLHFEDPKFKNLLKSNHVPFDFCSSFSELLNIRSIVSKQRNSKKSKKCWIQKIFFLMDVTKVKFSFQIEFCKFYGQVLFLFFPEDFLGLENPSIGCQNRALPSCNAAAEMSCDKTSQNFFFGPSKRSAEISI